MVCSVMHRVASPFCLFPVNNSQDWNNEQLHAIITWLVIRLIRRIHTSCSRWTKLGGWELPPRSGKRTTNLGLMFICVELAAILYSSATFMYYMAQIVEAQVDLTCIILSPKDRGLFRLKGGMVLQVSKILFLIKIVGITCQYFCLTDNIQKLLFSIWTSSLRQVP